MLIALHPGIISDIIMITMTATFFGMTRRHWIFSLCHSIEAMHFCSHIFNNNNNWFYTENNAIIEWGTVAASVLKCFIISLKIICSQSILFVHKLCCVVKGLRNFHHPIVKAFKSSHKKLLRRLWKENENNKRSTKMLSTM